MKIDFSKFRPVIIAGGSGTRFWPASRKSMPKQFLPFTSDGQSLIQQAAKRLEAFVSAEQILLISGAPYAKLCAEHLPKAQTILEPQPKNTAAAVGLAAAAVAIEDPEAVMMVNWSDAAIANEAVFADVVTKAYEYIQDSDALGIIGVQPTTPHTGYGYIESAEKITDGVLKVDRFLEKPDLATAKKFLEAGNFYWNPGIFIWKASSILKSFEQFMPEFYNDLVTLMEKWESPDREKLITEIFNRVESIAIDNAIMEKTNNLVIFPASDLGWSDVGSWDVWSDFHEKDTEGNSYLADVVSIDSKNNLVQTSSDKFIALIGMEDTVLVETDDAILVCKKDQAQKVKQIVEQLKSQTRTELV